MAPRTAAWLIAGMLIGIGSGAGAATTAQLDVARDKGLAWLLTHQRGDGSWQSNMGTEFAATSSAVDALGAAGVKFEPYAAGLAWLGNATVPSVDSLARTILSLSTAGLNTVPVAQKLLSWRNPTRGWGAYDAFGTTFPDTSLALGAMRRSPSVFSDTEIQATLCEILLAQSWATGPTFGRWSYVKVPATSAPPLLTTGAVVPTAYNVLELRAVFVAKGWSNVTCGTAYSLPQAYTNGLTWITAQKRNSDGGFGDAGVSTVLETALTYQALLAVAPADPAVAPALDFLIARQAQDGSWNGDAFLTALVLQVLPIGTPYAADTDTDTIPDRLETVLHTNPGVADSRWLAAGNGQTSVPAPNTTNDFNLLITTPARFTTGSPSASTMPGRSASPELATTLVAATAALIRERPDPFVLTFAADAFQTDVHKAAAVTQVPIVAPPGPGGIAPRIVLRYDSGTADDLVAENPAADTQAQSTGLGWTLDTGPAVIRDTKNTAVTTDDTFKLLLDGKTYALVLVDPVNGVYHTRDDTFLRAVYTAAADFWTVTLKDGTQHRLGFNADSKQQARVGPGWATVVTGRYAVDQVTTTSGVGIRYVYSKDTAAFANGLTYDAAMYLDTVTYAYAGGSLVGGVTRQLAFVRSARTDWPALGGSAPNVADRKRLDAIEVRLNGVLVRKYTLGYDYSIDRAPGTVWTGGGATGDLTLKTLTVWGSDGATALPSASFTYTSAGHLATAQNGLGATVTYTYDRIGTVAFYAVCSDASCTDRGVCTDRDPWHPSDPAVGYLLTAPSPSTVAIYSVCKVAGASGCADWGIGSGSGSTLLGYALAPSLPQVPGTVPLYSNCAGSCVASTVSGTLLGYMYPRHLDRARVVMRAANDGRGVTQTTTYTYSDAGLSSDGSEFRGYASARTADTAGTFTDSWFYQDEARRGLLYHAQTRNGSNALLRETINTFTTSTPYPGVTFTSLTQADTVTCDGACLVARTTFAYDAYGNPTRINALGDIAVSGDERDESTDWVVDTTNWVHRPSHVALKDGVGTVVRERWLSYDGLAWGTAGPKGLLTREERRLVGGVGISGNPVLTFGYDAYGNRISSTDAGGCTTTTTYEASQSFPATVTACLGLVTTLVHDLGQGARTRVTDPSSQVTSFTYDVFGRLTRATGPLDTAAAYGSVSYQYLNWGSATAQKVRTYQTQIHGTATASWTDEYFDGRGRIYARQSQAPAGQTIGTDLAFDSRGLVIQRSAPYAVGAETPVYTTYTYDVLGRIVLTRYPDNSTVTTAFATGGKKTVTDERGYAKNYYSDVWNRLTRVEELNGGVFATTYVYDAADRLTRITSPVNTVTTFTYDAVGRRTGLSDPNLGSWSFAYDARGNVTSRTDARGQTITFTYDLLGRMRTKTYPAGGGTITWTYDEPNASAPYTQGRLTRVNDLVTTTTLVYDKLGRVASASRLLDGSTYVLIQTYDAMGRVLSRTYPDGESVTFTYNEAGWLASIPGYVTAITYNARGQQTQIQYANNVTTALTYDPTAFRLTRRLTTAPGGTLQNLSYAYDFAGNVTKVVDSVGTASRSFGYDALKRLVTASGWLGGVSEQYSYDAVGDIVRRASILYVYSDAGHPWAVTATAEGRTYTYDLNGNATTAPGLTLTWDADNQLQTLTGADGTVTFAYDADGRGVRKTTAAGVTHVPFDGYEIDPVGVIRKWFGLVSKRGTSPWGQVRFYHDDHMGSTHVISDGNGATVQVMEYTPWGQVTRAEGTVDTTARFRTADLSGGRPRPYDPGLGRFLGVDPDAFELLDPQAQNRYAFARNNPVTMPHMRRSVFESQP